MDKKEALADLVREEEDQQAHYERIEKAVGSPSLALFCCCAAFDVPYVPKAVPRAGSEKVWKTYRETLRFKNYDKKGTKGFAQGVTDVLSLFGDEVPKEDVTAVLRQERSKQPEADEIPTVEQVETWGTGGEERPLTRADYDRLDHFYDTLTSRLEKAGGVDNQQELILRKVSELYLEEEKCRAAGNIADAQRCVKIALDLLSSEQLQRKDSRPAEEVRIDAIIDALEKWGAVKDGKILGFQDLTEFLLKQLGRLGGTPAHKYTQTLDAADYELLFIRNCMAQNEDQPRWMELPDNMRFGEEVAAEFASEAGDEEARAYAGIGIIPTRGKTGGEVEA